MGLSYGHRIIIQYLQTKLNYGAVRIFADHPEYGWNINTVKSSLRKIDETGDVNRKEGSGRPMSFRTEENIEYVEEMINNQEDKWGTHETPAEIANESPDQ